MMSTMDFHSQVASIMEVLANAAVAEICKVVDDGYAVVQLEMTQSQKDNECLRRKIKLLELQVARYRAERLRGAEGSVLSRFPSVRVLHRQSRDSPTGSPLHGRTRFINRARQSVQKTVPIILDQDPDQEVVTTTKMESPDAEEEQDICIVKVEGASQSGSTNSEAPLAPSINPRGILDASTVLHTPSPSQNINYVQPTTSQLKMEVSGSEVLTFVDRIPESDRDKDATLDFIGSDSGCSESRLGNSETITNSIRKENIAFSVVSPTAADVIVIDEDPSSDKERKDSGSSVIGNRSSNLSTSNAGVGRENQAQTTGPMLWSVARPGRTISTHQDSPATRSHLTTTSSSIFTDANTVHRANRKSQRSHCPVKQPEQNSHLSICHPTLSQISVVEKTYSCPTCRKRFLLESDLHKHMTRHTREKPYMCVVCGKSFVCQSQLDMHHNVHTGERPFSCTVCGRRFSHPSNLRRHLKIQHSTQRYHSNLK